MKREREIAIIDEDPWLEPYRNEIEDRIKRFKRARKEIKSIAGSVMEFSTAHKYFGINFDQEKKGWFYREWAPEATRLCLIGDFNEWDHNAHPLYRNEHGYWEIFLPYEQYHKSFCHKSRIKVHVVSAKGANDKIPAYITRVIQDPITYDFSGQLWFPTKAFEWTDRDFVFKRSKEPIIYEVHVGMAQEKEGVGTYREFADKLIPRIRQAGYNSIQLMAVMEHPYYGSFGYHVSNFFAPTSRFGTPEDLKYLVDRAHKYGLGVIMDVVHSHAVKNITEGLNEFDGSDHQYFHGGSRGNHDHWDSKIFDYGKLEVKRFLLSNIRYWLEEFHFDGFRFDGVTSMLYFHHGFTTFDHYDKYYNDVDWDALTYLQLANELIHKMNSRNISIAEDVSGMPGLSRKITDGGVDFDFRLGMGIPDYWIKILKEQRDEDWNIWEIWSTLVNRRYKEKTISYTESHDQALVGDKTLAFWLMDKEMYEHMMVDDQNAVIDRGLALHKMLRILTLSLGGEGYLNFMGNEFGHPEWIDFPREGNGWSYKHARRQWSLVDNSKLKYKFLAQFDEAMLRLTRRKHILSAPYVDQLNMDTDNNVIIYERGNLIFAFNFNVNNSILDYKFNVKNPGAYQIILNSDNPDFGGFNRIDEGIYYPTNENNQLSIYLTNRTALVFEKVQTQ
jgi:1,4-alpha-glucan branching enzyme